MTQPPFDRPLSQRWRLWLVDRTCLIGHHNILTGIPNAFEISPAPGAERL